MQRAGALFGIFVGASIAVGVATHNLALWIAMGVAIGAALSRVARGKETSNS